MKKIYLMFALSGAALGVFAPAASADEWNKETKITFNEPVEVPGKVLPPGTYQFKLLEGVTSDRYIVQIYDEKPTRLEATVLAIPDQREHASGKTVLQFAERPAGSPQAIKAWFYPGAHSGLEFVYPHDRAAELAKANREPVYSTRSDLSPYATKHMKSGDEDTVKMKHSEVKTVQPDGSENNLSPETP